MADNNPWLTPAVEHDSAPLVASSTSNPLRTGGRFGASSSVNAFDTPAQGGWDVPPARAPEAAHPTRGAAVLDVHAGDELARRERELKRKEEELEKRFSSLRLREAELGVTKNWPVYLKWCATLLFQIASARQCSGMLLQTKCATPATDCETYMAAPRASLAGHGLSLVPPLCHARARLRAFGAGLSSPPPPSTKGSITTSTKMYP